MMMSLKAMKMKAMIMNRRKELKEKHQTMLRHQDLQQ